MKITEILFAMALAANTFFSIIGAHGTPTSAELTARGIHESKARRSLEQCSAKLRSRDRLHKRATKRDAFVKRHLLKRHHKDHEVNHQQSAQEHQYSANGHHHHQPTNHWDYTTLTKSQSPAYATSLTPPKPGYSSYILPTNVTKTTSAAVSYGTSGAHSFPSLFPSVECILTPEVTVGPLYVAGDLVRDDIREDQPGIELIVDIQVVDVNTCEVIPNVYLDFWQCNSTGSYSGVSADNTLGLTFLRGIRFTDDDGIAQLITNFPGWYLGRATHLHVVAHLNSGLRENNTITGGSVAHIGQIFFHEEILRAIDTADVYKTNPIVRMPNSEDIYLLQGNTTEYDARATVDYLGDVLTDGLLAYITIGVDSSLDYTETLGAGLQINNTILPSTIPRSKTSSVCAAP